MNILLFSLPQDEMEDIVDILSFCYENNCTPSTLIFNEDINYDVLDDVVDNWKFGARSFLDPGLRLENNIEIRNLRKALMNKSSIEEVVDITKYEEEKFMFHKAYELIRGRNISLPETHVVSYNVECRIKKVEVELIFKDPKFPFMIYKGMRKIPSSFDKKIPEWFLEDAKYDDDSIYTRFRGMVLRISESQIWFKLDNGMDLDMILDEIMEIIGSEVLHVGKSKFITVSDMEMSSPWKDHIMADIITNNRRINQLMSIYERSRLLYEKRYITSLCMFCKFTVLDGNDTIRVRISSPKCLSDTMVVLSLVTALFGIYEEEYHRIDKLYSTILADNKKIPGHSHNILRTLRGIEPGLFINNYTRECPILPIIVDDANSVDKPCIKYHGRYYTAPDGYYVGLKMNRLPNRDKYKYLVTGYRTNHLLRENSITYKYVSGEEYNRKKSPSSNVRKIDSLSYQVVHCSSFSECMQKALGASSELRYGVCCKQDLWFMDISHITKNISNGVVDSSYYRYYEEVHSCNIIVITLSKGEYRLSIPKHKEKYIWNKHDSDRGILIIEIPPPVHIREETSYELITNIFDLSENNICSSFIGRKKAITVRGVEPRSPHPVEQYINHHGKCVMVRYKDGREERCNYRPLLLRTYEPYDGVIKNHLKLVNKIREKHDMENVVWHESDSRYTFFPNIESLMMWKNDKSR